jgi:hypothetical protein
MKIAAFAGSAFAGTVFTRAAFAGRSGARAGDLHAQGESWLDEGMKIAAFAGSAFAGADEDSFTGSFAGREMH